MWSYFRSREFILIILGLILASGLGYLVLFWLILPIYTKHGESVLVPDVSKLTFKQASSKLDDSDLDYEVRDSVYMPNLPALTVLKQYPSPLSVVKPGRTVFLTLNKIKPPMVKLPKVLDVPVYIAKRTLESWKLAVTDIRKVPDVAKDRVLKILASGKEIKPGAEIPQGTGVVLIIGEGLKDNYVKVPILVGLNYNQALLALQEADLGVGNVEYQEGGGPVGKIFRQHPLAEEDSVKAGWPIDIWISGKPQDVDEGPTVIDPQ
jgi:beta-lactam-binding protein with PASTA domain